MLSLKNIKPNKGSTKFSKRLGRGNGSGLGTFCGRGCNGQNSRSGGWVAAWFEWGQTPLFRRMPKLKWFSNIKFKTKYNIVNISDIALLAEKGITTINKEVLIENKIIRRKTLPIKLLAKGKLTVKVNIIINKASLTAKEVILKAGGKIEII